MNTADIQHYLATPAAADVSADLAASILRPGDHIGGLVAIAQIGRGATGDVWSVHDEASGQDLALKIFRPHGGVPPERTRERFCAEARLLSALRHSNLMRVFASDSFRGAPYFTMELLRPLPERMSARAIAALGRDLCRALAFLHAHGIVHRDLKPDNVLVAPDGRYVLADLGIAHLSDDALAGFVLGLGRGNPTLMGGTDHALGTPGFAAPEQMQGKAVSPAADIHALGVLFDDLFDGHPPFAWRILIRQMTSSLPALRSRSLAAVRRALLLLGILSPTRAWTAAALSLALIAGVIFYCRPKWEDLTPDDREADTIKMDGMEHELYGTRIFLRPGGRYTYTEDLIWFPDWCYDRKTDTVRYVRRPLVVSGPGTLKLSQIVGYDVYLVSNATLVTSGIVSTNTYSMRTMLINEYPAGESPKDANGLSLLLPAYHVESGSRVVFIDNPDYPQDLIQPYPGK